MSATPADFEAFYSSNEFKHFAALSDTEKAGVAVHLLIASVNAFGAPSTAELLGRCITSTGKLTRLEYVRREEDGRKDV